MSCKLTLDFINGYIHLFYARDDERSGLSSSVLSTSQNISARKNNWDRLLLNGGWLFKAFLENAHEQFAFQTIIFEFVALGGGDILWKNITIDEGTGRG